MNQMVQNHEPKYTTPAPMVWLPTLAHALPPPPYALPHWQVTVHQKCDIGADGSKLWPKRFYSCPDDLTHCPAPVTRVTLQVHPGAHLGASEGFTLQTSTHVRSCSPMDKAPDFWSGDCRFESCHGRYLLPFILCPLPRQWTRTDLGIAGLSPVTVDTFYLFPLGYTILHG